MNPLGRFAATSRRRLRQLAGTVLVSLGTAVFAGTVQIVVDAMVKGSGFRWPHIMGFTLLGLALSSAGAWLLTSLRSAAGFSIAATDHNGDAERYLDEAEAFARFGQRYFTTQTSLQVPVESPADLKQLRSRVTTGMRMLSQADHQISRIGLYFHGRQHVGFHLGGWLNATGRSIDLYTAADTDADDTHFVAAQLRPTIGTAPRPMVMHVHLSADGAFAAPELAVLADLPRLLQDVRGIIGLAIDVIDAPGNASFTASVLESARSEGAVAVVTLALPEQPNGVDAPGRGLASTTADWEGAAAAVVAAAQAIPADPGLLYMKTPTVLSVALGRYLYRRNWIPMQHQLKGQSRYKRFTDSTQR